MTVERVGIVGSGIMGAGIAECAASGGHEVVLRSRRPSYLDNVGRKAGRGFYRYDGRSPVR